VVVGAGGFGREVHGYAVELGWEVLGFVDDEPSALAGHPGLPPVLGRVDELDPSDGAEVVVAVGDASARADLAGKLAARGIGLATLVHPTAWVAPTARVGAGSILCPFAVVANAAVVGPNVVLNTFASVGHDAVVGAHCVFSPYSVVNGGVVLGEQVFLGTHAVVTPRLDVGARTKVAAGAVVTRSLDPGSLAVGMPATGRVVLPPGAD
jgi:sugar O-acyltransferase (sialic acid O-acetyltransferase NeuD family)